MAGSDQSAGPDGAARLSARDPWPARLDFLQSASGFLLVIFLCVHLLLDAAILIGPAAADVVARAFDGQYLFDRAHPWLVSLAALGVLGLIVVHAVLAMRKLPRSTREYRALRHHLRDFRHADSRLWWWQAITGVALFFLVAPHLVVVITQPEAIGATPSAHRIVVERAWMLYVILMPVVLLHAAAGAYRLVVKWGWPGVVREKLRVWVWGVAGGYLVLGIAALAVYAMLGLRLMA